MCPPTEYSHTRAHTLIPGSQVHPTEAHLKELFQTKLGHKTGRTASGHHLVTGLSSPHPPKVPEFSREHLFAVNHDMPSNLLQSNVEITYSDPSILKLV